MRKAHPYRRFLFACILLLALPVFAQLRQQGPKLTATDALPDSAQGDSVSISADGNTAIVGASGDNHQRGASWIWVRAGEVWLQQARLVGSGGVASPYQGHATALSADGNTAMVGGWNDDSGTGAAWVWTRSGGVWTQQGEKLIGSGAVGRARQGQSVALSADGNTAIVGGPYDDGNRGSAWVWTRSGGVWTQQGPKLVTADSTFYDQQGWSVAVSADGNTALLGSNNLNWGAASVWTRSGGVWNQQGPRLAAPEDVGQGFTVALSADGNTAITGTWFGGVWIWTRGSESWNQQGARLNDPSTVALGSSVSLSADGNTALIGGRLDGYVSSSEGATGAVWIFTRKEGSWYQQSSKVIGSGAVGHAFQGSSVALSGDGRTAIVGGPSDNQGAGAAWVFTEIPVPLRRRAMRP
jgi:hypothetical protein